MDDLKIKTALQDAVAAARTVEVLSAELDDLGKDPVIMAYLAKQESVTAAKKAAGDARNEYKAVLQAEVDAGAPVDQIKKLVGASLRAFETYSLINGWTEAKLVRWLEEREQAAPEIYGGYVEKKVKSTFFKDLAPSLYAKLVGDPDFFLDKDEGYNVTVATDILAALDKAEKSAEDN